ncbi:DNA translocase FtsK 4TM domain-containing protein, partial [Chelatococcus sp. SYSU_G07232]
MRTTRRTSSPADDLSDALRRFLARRAAEFVGLGLIALAAAAAVALASWSVDDPSFTHAKDGPVVNWLGMSGAVVADIGMQILGLGSIALVAPLAVWGMRLISRRALPRLPLRLGLWIAGTAAAAAVASAMPPTARWPLPTGLGGVVGDALLFGARGVLSLGSGPGAAIVGFVYAGVAILTLTAACGYGLVEDGDEAADGARAGRDPFDEEEDGRDEPGWGIISLGALVHGLMTVKAALARRLAGRAAQPLAAAAGRGFDAHRYADDPFAGLPRPVARGRRDPVFDGAAPMPADDAPHAPYDEDDDGPEMPVRPRSVPLPPQRGPASRAARSGRVGLAAPSAEADFVSSRVMPPAAAPRPGKRLAREQQPSLLDGEGYQLPPLTLLAEPKKSPAAAVSPEALEQNAAMLESTLEDFGVRGEIINVRPGPVVTLYELEPAP